MRAAAIAVTLVGPLVAGCPKRDEPRASTPDSTAAVASGEAPLAAPRAAAFSERLDERRTLVRSIGREGVKDARVLAALERVPRHAFVPDAVSDMAYRDRPLPIGSGQTISQPYIVAAMTEAAAPKPTDKCLEIGTGSGYQAAVLTEVCKQVYSIEYLPELAERAQKVLRALGYGPDRLALRSGDGYQGWPEAAPFDAIVVTAAPAKVPAPLFEQLAVGGRLVIPVGPHGEAQTLERWVRVRAGTDAGALKREELMGVRFVPFLGDAAARDGLK